jgi:hypothetical protein
MILYRAPVSRTEVMSSGLEMNDSLSRELRKVHLKQNNYNELVAVIKEISINWCNFWSRGWRSRMQANQLEFFSGNWTDLMRTSRLEKSPFPLKCQRERKYLKINKLVHE